jgi:hypothetical protein
MRTQGIFGTLATLIPLGLSLPIDDPSTFCAADTIERDVAIVGGGSSGAHAAVRVKDSGKTVVVIEKAGELGGHVKTYTAASGIRVNYGPSNFQPYPVVRDFFGRFNISLVRYEQPGVGDIYADFATGKSVPNGTIPVPDFTAYLEQVNKVSARVSTPFRRTDDKLPYFSILIWTSLGICRSQFLKIFYCHLASS